MVEHLHLQIRNQPDALAKLCHRYGLRLLKLARRSTGSKRENLKLRLIEYYVSKGSAWDRSQELDDWSEHNLASLKYETYRYSIRLLAQSGDMLNADLYTEIMEIVSAKEVSATRFAIELCNSVLPIAIEREEYSLAIHIIDLYDELVEELPKTSSSHVVLRQNAELRERVSARLAEVHKFAMIRRNLLEPIKEKWVETECPPLEFLGEIENICPILQDFQLASPIAQSDYLSLRILQSLLMKNNQRASEFARGLLEVYRESETLRTRHFKRYVQHLRMAALLFSQLGKDVEARKILGQLGAVSKINPGFYAESQFS